MIKQGKTPQGDKIARKRKREEEQYVSGQESDVGESQSQSEKVGKK
jgi:hypothetical protein